MNLADYLSELLEQYDEVSVPNLGYFIRERVNGFYNEREGKFYPPYHQAKFIPRPKDDDDTFVQYVADKKNISLASSKYFAEKFVSKLREQATTGKYPVANLGSFQVDEDQNLIFKAYGKIAADPAFYGYPPVEIHKSGQAGPDKQFVAEPASQVSAPVEQVSTPVEQVIEDQEGFEEEPVRKKRINIWVLVLIIITVLDLVLFGIYKFYPGTVETLNSTYYKIIGKQDTTVPVYNKKKKVNIIKKAVPVTDTSLKTAAPIAKPVDTVKHSHWEIIEGSFWQLYRANAQIKRLKARGLDAKILPAAPGQLLKVSVGEYPTQNEADSVRTILIKERKIRKHAQTLEINP